MKTFLTLCFICAFSLTQSFGQCQIPNGDFEEWEDLTADFEAELGIMLIEDVVGPANYFSILRLLTIGLSDIIVPFFDTGVADRPLFQSIQRAEPGANGSAAALQIGGDTLFLVSDLTTTFACGERPTSLKGFFSYSGTDNDSIAIGAIFHKGEASLNEETAVGAATFSARGTSSQFAEFEVPVTYATDEVPDSAIVVIIASKDESSKENTFFLVDELSFGGATVSTTDASTTVENLVAPNPVLSELVIQSISTTKDLEIVNLNGQVVKVWNKSNQTIEMGDLPSGHYFARATTNSGVLLQKVIKL